MTTNKEISAEVLTQWIVQQKAITILDIRPQTEREEWKIPGSVYINAYDDLKAGKADTLNSLEINKDNPVITVCSRGRLSMFAAELLAGKGFEAYSLKGGMREWNYAYDTSVQEFANFKIIQVRRVAKGCLSYVVGSNKSALVIDASLDPGVYADIAKTNGWEIELVTDTHIHADYVSRTIELANFTGATHVLNSNASVDFAFVPIADDETIVVGGIAIKVLHTPGHTPESTVFKIDGAAVFTGDTLFTNAVGRPDLKAGEAETIVKAKVLYHSLRRLIDQDENMFVYPAHSSDSIRIGQPMLTEQIKSIKLKMNILTMDEERFVQAIISKLPPAPPNYLTIAEINRAGKLGDWMIADLEAGANRCAVS